MHKGIAPLPLTRHRLQARIRALYPLRPIAHICHGHNTSRGGKKRLRLTPAILVVPIIGRSGSGGGGKARRMTHTSAKRPREMQHLRKSRQTRRGVDAAPRPHRGGRPPLTGRVPRLRCIGTISSTRDGMMRCDGAPYYFYYESQREAPKTLPPRCPSSHRAIQRLSFGRGARSTTLGSIFNSKVLF